MGQSPSPLPSNGIQLGKQQKQLWRIGVRVVATAPCEGLYATIPVPTNWPEQEVKIIDEEISSHVARVDYKLLDGGVQQMHISIPSLIAGETAVALVTLEVLKSAILPPADTKQFVIPKSPPRPVIRFLGISPYIEVRHPEIRGLARKLAADDRGGWETVEGIYDWVRDNVEYQNGPLKGALAALRDGTGDCEELTSLFVALCRANKIPARTVWIPGHCYPEFYLEDASGTGHWFPCQAAGRREFGAMEDFKPILQKGDNFHVPEKKREPQRYVSEFLTGRKFSRNGPPQVKWVRELLPAGP